MLSPASDSVHLQTNIHYVESSWCTQPTLLNFVWLNLFVLRTNTVSSVFYVSRIVDSRVQRTDILSVYPICFREFQNY